MNNGTGTGKISPWIRGPIGPVEHLRWFSVPTEGVSQPPVNPVPWYLKPSSGLCEDCTDVLHMQTNKQTHKLTNTEYF